MTKKPLIRMKVLGVGLFKDRDLVENGLRRQKEERGVGLLPDHPELVTMVWNRPKPKGGKVTRIDRATGERIEVYRSEIRRDEPDMVITAPPERYLVSVAKRVKNTVKPKRAKSKHQKHPHHKGTRG